MDSMLITVAGVLAIPGLLQIGQIQRLIDGRSWGLLTLLASMVGAAAVALHLQRLIDLSVVLALGMPLYHLLLFRLFLKVFVHTQGREPRNCALVFSSGLGTDRFFSITYFFVAIFSAFAFIGPALWKTGVGA